MKGINRMAVTATLLTLGFNLTPALAQEAEQTVIITGQIDYVDHPLLQGLGPMVEAYGFTATITEDISTLTPYLGGWSGGTGFQEVTIQTHFELFDPQGALIFENEQSTRDLAPTESVTDDVALYFYPDAQYPMPTAIWGIISSDSADGSNLRSEYVLGQNYFRSRVTPMPVSSGDLFADLSGPYPVLNTGLNAYPFQYSGTYGNSSVAETIFNFEGVATSVSYLLPDLDGDGIEDLIDSCPESLLNETVMFGSLDSGVDNRVDESGCSIMDRYAACNVDQEESPTLSWFRPVYSGPSYCEKQVAYGLVSDGLIDYSEARLLRDGLYQSYRNDERR